MNLPTLAAFLLSTLSCGGEAGTTARDGGPSDAADATAEPSPLVLEWERLADGGPAVAGASMAALGDRAVLFGGVEGATGYLDETWLWESGSWTRVAAEPHPPARTGAIFGAANGVLVLFSGVGRSTDGSVAYLEDTWTFDGTSWTELEVSAGPTPRQNVAVGSLGGALYIQGGATRASGRLADGWRFDGTSWTELPPGPPAQRAATLTAVEDTLLFTGGSTPGAFAGVLRFDATAWNEVGSFSMGRAYHGAAAMEGHLVVFGGVQTSTTGIALTEAFPGPMELVGDEPGPHNAPSMVTLSDGALMHLGGMAPETWRLRAR